MTPIDAAVVLACRAVADATGFLDGRHSAEQLAGHAETLFLELIAADQANTKRILDPVRLLTVAMMQTARHARERDTWLGIRQGLGITGSEAEARQQRWQAVMASLVELVCHESRALRTAEPLSNADEEKLRESWST